MRSETLKMAWSMLTRREKWMSATMILVAVAAAAAQVMMIGAIFPFLSVLADPEIIERNKYLSAAYKTLGFQTSYGFVMALGAGVVLLILVSNAVMLLKTYVVARFSLMRMHSISARLAKSYLHRKYEYFLGKNSADMAKRILVETTEIAQSFLQPMAELVTSGLSVLAIIGFLVTVQPVATLVGVSSVVLFYGLVYLVVSGQLNRLGAARIEANKRRFSAINDALLGIKSIKVLRKEGFFFRNFEAASRTTVKTEISKRVMGEVPRFVMQGLFFSGIIVACLLLIEPKSFGTGDSPIIGMVPMLGMFAFAGQRLIPEAQRVYLALSRIAFGAAAIRNVYEDLEVSEKSGEELAPLPYERRLTLENVSFNYSGAKFSGIRDITLDIPKGMKIGIAGGTGAGKTTLVDILLSLLEPGSGRFLVDGYPLSSRGDMARWRRKVGYVPQEIFLVDGSITENIALGVPAARIDHDRVKECARAAHLHDFITQQMPGGYDGGIGDRGVKLSGGQRQRIGIARALYHDAEFLVLDEATSALDMNTERDVMAAINQLPNNVTVVMIAHRLSTLRQCDEIVVMDQGEIIEKGGWDELRARGGAFEAMLTAHENKMEDC